MLFRSGGFDLATRVPLAALPREAKLTAGVRAEHLVVDAASTFIAKADVVERLGERLAPRDPLARLVGPERDTVGSGPGVRVLVDVGLRGELARRREGTRLVEQVLEARLVRRGALLVLGALVLTVISQALDKKPEALVQPA